MFQLVREGPAKERLYRGARAPSANPKHIRKGPLYFSLEHAAGAASITATDLNRLSFEEYRPSDSRLSEKLVPTFADIGVSRGQRNRSPRPYYRISRPEPLLFPPGTSSIVLTRLSGFSGNVVAPGIEPGISGSVARNSDH
jgi:hypothetical protein